jgi:hypothetical protein
MIHDKRSQARHTRALEQTASRAVVPRPAKADDKAVHTSLDEIRQSLVATPNRDSTHFLAPESLIRIQHSPRRRLPREQQSLNDDCGMSASSQYDIPSAFFNH